MIVKLAFILFGVVLVLWGIYSTKTYESFLDKLTGIGQLLAELHAYCWYFILYN